MPFEVEQPEDRGFVRVTFVGVVALEDVVAASDQLISDGVFTSDRRLWDFRGCELELSGADLRRLGDLGKQREAGTGRVAVVVDQDLSFGLFRMHEVYRESEDTTLHVFRDENEALLWLRAGHGS